jgi:hypothetical protein
MAVAINNRGDIVGASGSTAAIWVRTSRRSGGPSGGPHSPTHSFAKCVGCASCKAFDSGDCLQPLVPFKAETPDSHKCVARHG